MAAQERGFPGGADDGAVGVGDGRGGGRGRRGSRCPGGGWAAGVLSVVPGVLVRPGVQASPGGLRLTGGAAVEAAAVLEVREGPALRDEPAVDLGAADGADADQAAVPVGVLLHAGDGLVSDQISQRERSFAAAAVGLPGPGAGLAAFGRVDALQADLDAADLEGVAVGDGGDAGDGGGDLRGCGG